ncbi:MAG: exodeoxyribonuclease III [Rhodospirillales bacterium]|nr:exodeoxyribonuclease III [Rhodospirillales bacterium]
MPLPPVAAARLSPLTKIATWNVNSVRTREAHVVDFLTREQPDFLLLQEIKCEAHQFPAMAFSALGYEAEIVGQKSYNGVAILHKGDVEVTHRRLPGMNEDDSHARFVEVRARGMKIGGLYLPNGNSGGDSGYQYKLHWMAALREHAAAMMEADEDFILAGDYNVCPTDADFAPRALPANDALIRPETRAAFHALLHTGLTEAVRALHPKESLYTFWDYQAGAWDRNIGLRIDHALLSPRLAERLVSVTIHKDERAKAQPSDHVPVSVVLT